MAGVETEANAGVLEFLGRQNREMPPRGWKHPQHQDGGAGG